MGIDRIDARLLLAVQQDNRLSAEALGGKVGLSATACHRRLKRLRDEGVIEADISVVNPKAAGRPISMLVLVSLERERADIVDHFKAAIRGTAEVMNGYYVTGDADFALVVTCKNMEDYDQFTRRFFYENADIKGVKTMVVLDRIKYGSAIPIEPTDPE
jgi:Lrp/AsnC family leucine-responsive transcriptional regulator